MKNLTPCTECQHYAICRITDTYTRSVKELERRNVSEAEEVTIRCLHFHKSVLTPRTITLDDDRHYGENK